MKRTVSEKGFSGWAVVRYVLKAAVFVFMGSLFARVASPVSANEGRIVLRDGAVLCEGNSVWQRDTYRIMGRCGGLIYPYAERLDNYILWVQPQEGGDPVRIAEIDRGFFEGQTDRRFTEVFVTAEEDGLPRTPGATRIASGAIQAFDFPPSERVEQVREAAPQPTGPTSTPVPEATRAVSGANLRQIGTVVLIAIVIIAGLFVVIPLLLRKS